MTHNLSGKIDLIKNVILNRQMIKQKSNKVNFILFYFFLLSPSHAFIPSKTFFFLNLY